ncbi:hypothetical protein [Jatrophihabitans fulvus]
MNPTTMPQRHGRPQQGPDRDVRPGLWQVPAAFWVGLGIAAVAFVVHIESLTVRTSTLGGRPEYSCQYSDLVGFFAALAILATVAAGWAHRRSRHPRAKLPMPYMAVFTVVLVALSVMHALRGNGTIMSPCDARPMP